MIQSHTPSTGEQIAGKWARKTVIVWGDVAAEIDAAIAKSYQPMSLKKCAAALKQKWLNTRNIDSNPGINWLELAEAVLESAIAQGAQIYVE
jgi:hypothetical protein